ncbi:hypothetical protein Pryu01_02122 [Paraliobacillus ryukyuensis]|uniref:Acetyl esterase/lipase n=1 Tax=Paraliobacillus ryukyuensis TaxID=200904 RepID=A0A366E4X7_9BACI|nr:alpha/beta hydrolase [Paraliobacillus ryukyuensis]RBO97145.1 acetyl esterase/lipase [Paraliobacillus ryukyuensis]
MYTEKIKFYENRNDVTLTAYVLDDSSELLNGKRRPAILICPGGAYLNCSDREAEPVALRFVAMGYHAFVLRYSTYTGGSSQPLELNQEMSVNENITHPTPMREIGQAMLTIKEHAEDWLVDVEKIALCGFSAGAHNCAMYSVYWDKPIITEYFNERIEPVKPAATILGYGYYDHWLMRAMSQTPDDKHFFAMSNLAFSGYKEPDDNLMKEISPVLHVSASTPPMFLWATAADDLVPAQQTLRMAHALADNHIPYEVHIYEEGDHGLSLADQASARDNSQLNQHVSKWILEVETWLKRRIGIELTS